MCKPDGPRAQSLGRRGGEEGGRRKEQEERKGQEEGRRRREEGAEGAEGGRREHLAEDLAAGCHRAASHAGPATGRCWRQYMFHKFSL